MENGWNDFYRSHSSPVISEQNNFLTATVALQKSFHIALSGQSLKENIKIPNIFTILITFNAKA